MAEPPAKRQCQDHSEDVIVCVGNVEDEKEFTVPKDLIVKSSNFFQAALNGDWNESHERRVSLPEASRAGFATYLEWLSTGRLVLFEHQASEDESSELESSESESESLDCESPDDWSRFGGAPEDWIAKTHNYVMTTIHLHLLSQYLQDDRFGNATIDAVIPGCRLERWQNMDDWMDFTPEDVDYVWDETHEGSKLRVFFIHSICCHVRACYYCPYFERKGEWSKEISAEVFDSMTSFHKKGKCPQEAVSKDQCALFHEHDEDYPECHAK